MKFTAALYASWKPRYYLMDRTTNLLVHQLLDDPGDFSSDPRFYVHAVDGWEKRAEPGDIIALKPHGSDWTDLEKKQFLIVELDGIDEREAETIVEPSWDLNSYKAYEGLEPNTWYDIMIAKALGKDNPDKAIKVLNDKKDSLYSDFIEAMKERCRYPTKYLKKRRFKVKMDDLAALGVDLELMLDEQVLYAPKVKTDKYGYFDKLKERYIIPEDGLNWIAPRSDAEILG